MYPKCSSFLQHEADIFAETDNNDADDKNEAQASEVTNLHHSDYVPKDEENVPPAALSTNQSTRDPDSQLGTLNITSLAQEAGFFENHSFWAQWYF